MKDIVIPDLVESIDSGTISAWLVQEGDVVQEGDPIIELETDKIVVNINAEANGTIAEIIKGDFEDVAVGEVVGKIDQSGNSTSAPGERNESQESTALDPAEEESKEAASVQKQAVVETRPDSPAAPPAARKQARETGQDLQTGSQAPKASTQAGKFSDDATKPAERPENPMKPVKVERFSRRRQTIAANLVEAQQTMAMLTTFNEVDMTEIMAFRKEVQEEFVAENDIKLGFMSFFVKASVGALKKFPAINSELQGNELHLKEYYDIGVAVSTDDGLVVPVVRDTDKKNFAQIEQDIAELAGKAREGRLALDDMQGGTFTITNGGIFGSTFSTPIINMPQAAILGMHNIVKRPVAMSDGSVEVRPMMQVALTYDHRIVDGKDAAGFLTYLTKLLNNPKKLLIEG